MLLAEGGRGLNHEDRFVSDNAPGFVVFTVTGENDAIAGRGEAGIAFAGFSNPDAGVFEQGDQARFIFGGSLRQPQKPCGLRGGQGTDHRPIGFTHAFDSIGQEGKRLDGGVQAYVESVGKNMGQVIVALQDVETRTVWTGDKAVFRVEDWRYDGTELAQAGEKFLFEFRRLRRKILDAVVD